MNQIRIIFVITLLLLGGCATTERVAMKPDVFIEQLTIEENIQTADEFYYIGPGFGVGMLFGAVGGAVAGADSASKTDQLKAFAKEHNILIDEIVRNSFISAINQTGEIAVSENTDTRLKINVKQYGLSIPHGFSGNLVPVLLVEAEIFSNAGTVLWRDSSHILPLGNPAQPFKLEELKDNPNLLRDAWEAAAYKAATDLIAKL